MKLQSAVKSFYQMSKSLVFEQNITGKVFQKNNC